METSLLKLSRMLVNLSFETLNLLRITPKLYPSAETRDRVEFRRLSVRVTQPYIFFSSFFFSLDQAIHLGFYRRSR